ncbi:MAG TPA: helix-turn-helix domain-containing protein [Solirubrobacteraceae bacterium]|nr:helix-turn-helix domain-containing protein [Solirubrobacteraceae bacterium]
MRRVGEALAGRYAEIGQAIAARIVDEIPGYRDAAPELIDDLRAGATATAEVLARTFAEGSTVRREDLAFLRGLAARRVHQGVGLEVFIHAYRVALLAYWDACADEATRLRISRPAGFALASSAIEAIDIVTTQAAEAYLREETRLRTQTGRAVRDLVDRLVDGQPIDLGRRHPAAPGLDPTGELLTIVGRVEQTTVAVADALQLARDVLEESMSLGTITPLTTIRHGELVLISAGTSPRAKIASLNEARQRTIDEHHTDVRYGISVPARGFAGVQQAYREAALSLSYTSATRPIVSLDDLSSLECAVIGATATTKAVIASKGSGLRALSADDLAVAVGTIRAFSNADLNVARAAEQMHVHPNTVRYRLQQIATKTGHDPRTFTGLVDLVCILEMAGNEQRP